ncbi:MAG: acyl-CoA thioesterase [Acidimicrobiales bacterium]
MSALDDLVAVLTLEPLGDDRFRGRGSDHDGVDATFGGHFLGQATAAACATVDDDRRLHSLHAYFLRAGAPGSPFELDVERVRDGRSFCTRRVTVHQDPAKPQFELLASFAVDEDGPRSDPPPPADFASLPDPGSLPSYRELMASLDPLPLPAEWALRDYGLDIRTVDAPWAPAGPSTDGGIRLWVRADGALPADHHLQTAVLAYQSDESLADNVAVPWGKTWGSPGVVFVSLDHALWIHRPFDLNDWLFVDQRPVVVGHGRGLATASVWNRNGEQVATFTQEALFRLDPDQR